MKIGILAVQGAFIEHEKRLKALGAKCVQLRQKADLTDIDGLVLPGGESTVQGQLMRELDLFETLKEKIEGGLPVLATCAGLILLSQKISNDDNVYFGTLPVTTKRNAYGRQLGSFQVTEQFEGIGEVPMTFIRAPYIEQVNSPDVEILSKYDGKITGVRYKNQIALSFHPELDQDERIHRYFLGMI
jgi:5'-phosphate synthase pdxT subunit